MPRPRKQLVEGDEPRCSIVLDSGAYSAWAKETTISLAKYIAFCKEAEPYVDHIVNLDVIPGQYGRIPSSEEVEASAEQGWLNYQRMRRAGLNPMPVFHQGERLYWLSKMMEVTDYIGISPANDRTTGEKREWLDQVFAFACDEDGWPKFKAHGFGMTSLPLLFRYPWYSADSTSWALFGGYGIVLIPQTVNGVFVYDRSPNLIVMSNIDPPPGSSKTSFRQLPEGGKQRVRNYIESKGLSVEECFHHYTARDRANIHFFLDVEKHSVMRPFKRVANGFFR